ncbi:MAG: hypothetical protein C5S49_06330 [Candidatus Methanogaster sp.]|nr:MAG: hypothetical protein C5S49_06330 [ANME-2 cluster archaeon]
MNYNGVVVVNAKNANFNAGFDGLPRRLPTGRIFATDKALKYCIREHLSKTEPVFVQRTKEFYESKGAVVQRYLTLKANYLKKCPTEDDKLPNNEEVIINDLKGFIDIRLFGVVFAVDSNISITGPCQINYGINRFEGSNIFSSDILSPYRRETKDKGRESSTSKKETQQTTIGEESRADNVYYVYDVCLNMNSAEKQGIEVTDDDITKLKNALKYAVGDVTSTTMFGCETVSMIWFRNNDDRIFNNLNSLVEIYGADDGMVVDYSKVLKLVLADIDTDSLEEYSSKVKNIIPL